MTDVTRIFMDMSHTNFFASVFGNVFTIFFRPINLTFYRRLYYFFTYILLKIYITDGVFQTPDLNAPSNVSNVLVNVNTLSILTYKEYIWFHLKVAWYLKFHWLTFHFISNLVFHSYLLRLQTSFVFCSLFHSD